MHPPEKNRLFYGWVIVIAFFVICFVLYGVQFSFGVFFKSIENEFLISRAVTSSILSVYMILVGISAFIAGWAVDRFGPRTVLFLMGLFTGLSLILTGQTDSLWQLYFTYSLLLAMGTGAVFVVSVSTVARWFDRRRGLAMGITGSGVGFGPLIIAPVATYLVATVDWRLAYVIIGVGAWVLTLPFSFLLKGDPSQVGALPDGAREPVLNSGQNNLRAGYLSLLQAARVRSFWFCQVIWVFHAVNVFLIMTHLVPHVTDIGFSAMEAAIVLGVIGVGSTFGRIIMGVVSDRMGGKMTVILCGIFQSSATVSLIWVQDLPAFYLFAVAWGIAFGGMAPAMGTLASSTFGLGRIGSILGVLEMGLGIGAAVGSVVGGFIFDLTGGYTLAFLLGTTATLIVMVTVSFVRKETVPISRPLNG
ncbi:MAG: MFS transporter [Dehalococcoidales bacterium]